MGKKKLDFNVPSKKLDGTNNEGDDGLLSRMLAGMLAGSVDTNESLRLKSYAWVAELYNNGVLELDAADRKTLKNAVTNSRLLNNWQAGQLLDVLEKADK